ncbi:MAG: DUF4215 domain-containing protein, partial [Myxococcales bacterium]|nr:DUF4215 domain-containing protein [Myxococcales bacterium]
GMPPVDDCSRDMPCALELDTPFEYSNDPEGDIDWFAFTLAEPANVVIETVSAANAVECEGDTVLSLFYEGNDSDDDYDARDDDDGPEACSQIAPARDSGARLVPAGTHLVRAEEFFNDGLAGPNLITVRTLPGIAVGEPCDGDDELDTCVYDAWCDFGLDTPACVQNACGDEEVAGAEQCDDGNDDITDGCDACQIVPIPEGAACDPDSDVFVCDAGLFCHPDDEICAPVMCGDGFVGGEEMCDDGNQDPNDGCDACAIVAIPEGSACDEDSDVFLCEEGTFCHPDDAVCAPIVCGDGLVAGTEECDDENDAANDGCDACLIVPIPADGPCTPGDDLFTCADGLFCNPDLDICVEAVCGDGFVNLDDEECDDADDDNGDGCTDQCLLDPFNGPNEPDSREVPWELDLAGGADRVIFAIEEAGDADWFTFTLDAPATVGIVGSNLALDGCTGDPEFFVYRAGEEDDFASDDDDGPGVCPQLELELEAGVYEIKAEHFSNSGTVGPNWLMVRILGEAPMIGEACQGFDPFRPCPQGTYCSEGENPVCTEHVCGDERIGADETCDDGN